MNGSASTRARTDIKDRRAGLIVMGSLEIILGALSAAMMSLVILFAAMDSRMGGGQNLQLIATSVAVYGLLGVALVCLGIGSILCRRWARALLLILSWSWLASGVCVTIIYFAFARSLGIGAATGAAASPLMVIVGIFQLIFMVVVPGAMVLFYESRHVKATCESRDPVPRWTDTCPLPVLGTSLWLVIGALSLIAAPLLNRSMVPLFGRLVTGTTGTLILLVCAAAWIYLAWATYRLRISGWWMTLLVFALSSMSVAMTFFKVDLIEVYRKMGYPEQIIDQLRASGFPTGKIMAWWTVLFFALFLIYLIWIKKFFRKEAVNAPGNAAA